MKLHFSGKIKVPYITFPLKEAAKAQEYMIKAQQFGKIDSSAEKIVFNSMKSIKNKIL